MFICCNVRKQTAAPDISSELVCSRMHIEEMSNVEALISSSDFISGACSQSLLALSLAHTHTTHTHMDQALVSTHGHVKKHPTIHQVQFEKNAEPGAFQCAGSASKRHDGTRREH